MQYYDPRCMCGATDCPSCGPAQGFALYDEDSESPPATIDEVNDAACSITDEECAVLNDMLLLAINSDKITAEQIGEYLISITEKKIDANRES